MKGKGHELSDFNRVMKVLRGWHFEAMPKIEVSYFAERMLKAGNEKEVKPFIQKLRNVYKGLEVLDEFNPTAEEQQQTGPGEKQAPKPQGGMFEYINTSSTQPAYSGYDDYANFLQSRPSGPTYKKGQPFFKLMDGGPSQGQNTYPSQGGLGFVHDEPPQQPQRMEDLTEEQLRIIEENRKKAQERKRKREEESKR